MSDHYVLPDWFQILVFSTCVLCSLFLLFMLIVAVFIIRANWPYIANVIRVTLFQIIEAFPLCNVKASHIETQSRPHLTAVCTGCSQSVDASGSRCMACNRYTESTRPPLFYPKCPACSETVTLFTTICIKCRQPLSTYWNAVLPGGYAEHLEGQGQAYQRISICGTWQDKHLHQLIDDEDLS